MWGRLWHFALRVSDSELIDERQVLGDLAQWRNGGLSFHLGLSSDYDQFVLGWSGPFFALMWVLMGRIPGVADFFVERLSELLERVASASSLIYLPAALWLAHLCAANQRRSDYEWVRAYVNRREGVPKSMRHLPPNCIGSFEDGDWLEQINDATEWVSMPPFDEFRSALRHSEMTSGERLQQAQGLAIRVLVDQMFPLKWAPAITSLFHAAEGVGDTERAAGSDTSLGVPFP